MLGQAKILAKRYYALTGRPLGVTGEVAEFEAIRLLRLRPAPPRTPGYDAIGTIVRRYETVQIKGRCFPDRLKRSARLGRIDVTKPCDSVLLVLLDADYNATAIHQAPWRKVRAALVKPGSKARTERGQLSVSTFLGLSTQIWPRAR